MSGAFQSFWELSLTAAYVSLRFRIHSKQQLACFAQINSGPDWDKVVVIAPARAWQQADKSAEQQDRPMARTLFFDPAFLYNGNYLRRQLKPLSDWSLIIIQSATSI